MIDKSTLSTYYSSNSQILPKIKAPHFLGQLKGI